MNEDKPELKPLTFADWYKFKTGVTLEQAKRAGVYDLGLLEEAFNFSNTRNKPQSDSNTETATA